MSTDSDPTLAVAHGGSIEPGSPLDLALDAAVRYHFESRAEAARAVGAIPLPFDQIGDRSKRIVRLQLQGITEAILKTVPNSALWPEQGRFFTRGTMHDSEQLHDDVRHLLLAVGLDDYARPMSPHQVIADEVLPRVVALQRFWESAGHHSSSPADPASDHFDEMAARLIAAGKCPARHDFGNATWWCRGPLGHDGWHEDIKGRLFRWDPSPAAVEAGATQPQETLNAPAPHLSPDPHAITAYRSQLPNHVVDTVTADDPTRCPSTLNGRRCMISDGHHGTHYDGQAASW